MYQPVTLSLLLSLSCQLALGLPSTVNHQAYALEIHQAYALEIHQAADYRHYNPKTLTDLLQRLPGISIGTRRQGHEEIQLQGLDSGYLQLLINGQPVSGSAANNSLPTRLIPASLVERIEISRNARSDSYTGGGGAGTINVVLANGQSPAALQLDAGGTPLNHRQMAALHWQYGPQAIWLGGEHRLERLHRDGSSRTGSGDGQWQQNLRHQQQSVLLSYSGLFNDLHPLRLYLLQLDSADHDRQQGWPVTDTLSSTVAALTPTSQQRRQDLFSRRFGADMNLFWDEWELHLFVMHERTQQHTTWRVHGAEAASQDQDNQEQRLHSGWQLQRAEGEHRWSTGLSLEYRERRTDTRSTAVLTNNNRAAALPYNINYDEYRLSYSLLDRWQITPNTRMEAGFHLDNVALQQSNRGDNRESADFSSSHWLPAFHLLHQLSGRSRLRLSMSQSTRQPEITDRIPYRIRQDDRLWQGNKRLRAEVISQMDIGYEHHQRLPGSSRTDQQHGYQVRLFQRRISQAVVTSTDQVILEGDLLTRFTPVNSQDSLVLRGLEADTAWLLPWADLRFESGLGLYHAEQQPDVTTERPPGQPRYQLRLGLMQNRLFWRHGFLWRLQDNTREYWPGADGSTQEQHRSALQHLDVYTEREWGVWRAGASLLLTNEVRWHQYDRDQQQNAAWQLRLSLSAQF